MSTVSGRYFLDRNKNNLEDSADIGIGGAKVYLVSGNKVVSTATTNPWGGYQFNNVEPGFYHVHFAPSQYGSNFVKGNVGTNQSIDSDVWKKAGGNVGVSESFYVKANSSVSHIDAGVAQGSSSSQSTGGSTSSNVGGGTSTISGRYFRDNNDSFLEDAGDTGVANATVRLIKNNKVVATTKTDGGGNYSFKEVPAGTYNVEFASVSGSLKFIKSNYGGASKETVHSDVWKTNADGSGTSQSVTVWNGKSAYNLDGGVTSTGGSPSPSPLTSTGGNGSIAGRYFRDVNKSNLEDGGDTGVAGANVRLMAGNKVVATTKTDGNGYYKFANVAKGNYEVQFASVSNSLSFIKSNFGGSSKEAVHSDVWTTKGGWGVSQNINLNNGQQVRDIDAGVASTGGSVPAPAPLTSSAPTGAISGRYFKDNNKTGYEDGGDTGVNGAHVRLVEGAKVVATTNTDANGNYSFNGLDDGHYTVQFAKVTGWNFVQSNKGGASKEAVHSDVWTTSGNYGVAQTVQINNGSKAFNLDAGIATPGGTSTTTTTTTTTNNNNNNNNNSTPSPNTNAADDLKVLFIGNSITYYAPKGNYDNSMPVMFQEMARAAGYDVTYKGFFMGGKSLPVIWGNNNSYNAKSIIANGDIDLVVVQDNNWNTGAIDNVVGQIKSYAESYGAEVMMTSLYAWDTVISYNGGDNIAANVDNAFDSVADKYGLAYSTTGLAYTKLHRALTEKYGNGDDGQTAENMLTEDFIHASEMTAYLGANSVFAAAFGHKAPGNSAYNPANVSNADAAMIQDIAWETMVQSGNFSDGDWLV